MPEIPAVILVRTIETLGSEAKAVGWLTTARPRSLDGRAPVDLLDSEEGRRAVMTVLRQLSVIAALTVRYRHS